MLNIKAEVAETALVVDNLSPERITHFEQRYDEILQQEFAVNPAPATPAPQKRGWQNAFFTA